MPLKKKELLQNGGGGGNRTNDGEQHDGDDVHKAMNWLPDGQAFYIAPKVFFNVVLEKHFHGTKYESFTRKLNRWYVHTQVYYVGEACRAKPHFFSSLQFAREETQQAHFLISIFC
jgi:hypothetical protein